MFLAFSSLDLTVYAEEPVVQDEEIVKEEEPAESDAQQGGDEEQTETEGAGKTTEPEESVEQGEQVENPSEESTSEESQSDELTENEEETEEELVEEAESDEIVSFDELETIHTEYKLALTSLEKQFPEYVVANIGKEKVKIRIYDWVPVDDYDDTLGTYTFEPVINTDYKISKDAKTPTLIVEVDDETSGPTGYIDTDEGYDVPSVGKITSDMVSAGVQDAKFDGYAAGYLPEIRDQGAEGACWSFSAMASIEADLIKNSGESRSIDLSELQLAYYTTFGYVDPKNCHNNDTYSYTGEAGKWLDNGGNVSIASEALMNKVGPVKEEYVPYQLGNSAQPDSKYAVSKDYAEVTDVYKISLNDKALIKQAILDHGAVSASFWAETGEYQSGAVVRYSATYNSFYGTMSRTNHAVAIVGWDDNFSKDNFYSSCKPSGDGAWLVRNSWGLDDYGKNGYFWLSYYDAGLLSSKNVTAFSVSKNIYDNVYAYATSNNTYGYDNDGANQIEYYTTYKVSAGESVEAVAVEIMDANASVKVTVSDGKNSSSGQKTYTTAGIYTIPLSSALNISKDSEVTVTVKISVPTGKVAHAVCEAAGVAVGDIEHRIQSDKGFVIKGDRNTRCSSDACVKLFTNNTTSQSVPGKLSVENGRIKDLPGTTHEIKLSTGSVTEDVSAINWSVNDSGVATVSSDGVITIGKKKGTTAVTGTYTDASGNEYEVSISVTVKPYSITYVLDDDVIMTKSYKTYYTDSVEDCNLPTNTIAIKKGYYLAGWYSDAELTQEIFGWENVNGAKQNDGAKKLSECTGNLTVYPKWQKMAYYVGMVEPNSDLTGFTTSTNQICKYLKIDDLPYTLPTAEEAYTNPNNYVGSTGKAFMYWSLDEAGNNPITEITVDNLPYTYREDLNCYSLGSSIYVYPQYGEAEECTVIFDPNGGTCDIESKVVKNAGKYGTLPTPTREGYKFEGWRVNSETGSSVTESSIVSVASNHTLVAKWSANRYTVTYDFNGGSGYASSKSVYYGSKYPTLITPTKTGYTFEGWHLNNVDGELIESTSIVSIAADHTLVAKWKIKDYTLSFNANGGEVTTTSKKVAYNSAYGELPVPTRAGYSFDGWYTSTYSGTKVTEETVMNRDSDVTVYARWSAGTYTVTFDANGGECGTDSKSVTYNSTYGTLPTPTREGYKFEGWYTSADAGTKVTSTTSVTQTENHSLYAHWTGMQYKVTFDSGSVSSIFVTYGKEYAGLPTPKRTGYTFTGWHLGAADGELITTSTIVETASNHKLVATWKANEYTITFNPNGDNVQLEINSKTVEYDQTYGALPTPTRVGYTFAGWYTTVTAGTHITSESMCYLTSNQKLYAHWKAKVVQISFDANGGTIGSTSTNVTFGQTYGYLKPPYRPGYTFANWHLNTVDGEVITGSSIVDTAEDHTIVAEWKANSYTVTFHANGGTLDTTSKEVKFGDKLGTLPVPVKEGYTFVAWHNGYTESDPVIDENTIVNSTSDLYVYAEWKVNSYTVNFDANGGQVDMTSKEVTFDSAYGELPTPTKNNYLFEGWHLDNVDGEKVYDSTSVTRSSNHTLVANWLRDGYDITFDATYGSFGIDESSNAIKTETIVLKKGDMYGKYGEFPVPTCKGKYLVGWYTDNGVWTHEITPESVFLLSENQTIYARWENMQKVAKPEVSVAYTYGDDEETVGIGSTVCASSATNGAKVFYTTEANLDGLVDCTSSDITLNEVATYTYYFVAKKDNWEDSDVVSKTFTVVEMPSGILEEDLDEYIALGKPEGIWIAGLADSYEYKGAAYVFTPDTDFRVYDGTQLLKNKTDYAYAIKGNTNAGNMTITITGKGNYSGTYAKTIKITPKDLDACTKMLQNGAYYVQAKSLVKPAVIVTDFRNGANVILANKKDYTIEYSEYSTPSTITSPDGNQITTEVVALTKNPGLKQVVIKGKGNYKGIAVLNYTTQSKDEYTAPIKLTAKNLTIPGFEKKLIWKIGENNQDYSVVKCNGVELKEGQDYRLVRSNRTALGKATDTIYGIGKYAGSVSYGYQIVTAATLTAKNTKIEIGNKSFVFKNEAIEASELDVSVKLVDNDGNETSLDLGEDFEVVMPKDSTNVGKKVITIKGINKYAGSFQPKEQFEITKADTSEIEVVYDENVSYIKNGVKQTPKLIFNGAELNDAQIKANFTLKWTGKTDALSNVTFTAVPKNNFNGDSISVEYSINAKDISEITNVTCADIVASSKAGAYKSVPVLTDSNGKKLVAGKDYKKLTDDEYTYEDATTVQVKEGKKLVSVKRMAGDTVQKTDIIPAGTSINVKITGIGNYDESMIVNYKVIAGDLSKATITINPNGTLKNGTNYTGKAQLIDKDSNITTVKIGKTELSAQDYRIAGYKNNLKKGKATIILEGIGNYGGSLSYTFNINAKSMSYKLSYVVPEQTINGEKLVTKGTMAVTQSGNGVFTLPQPSFKVDSKKYVFEGWYTDPEFTEKLGVKGTKIDASGYIEPSQTLTIYAKYVKKNK